MNNLLTLLLGENVLKSEMAEFSNMILDYVYRP